MNVLLATFEDGYRGISIRYLSSYVNKLGYKASLLFFDIKRAEYQDRHYFSKNEIDAVASFIRKNKINVFGMSIMTGHFLYAKDLISKLKPIFPKIKFVLGGIHTTIKPLECLETGCDFVVVGDGEIPLKKILENKPPSNISGLVFLNQKGKVIVNETKKRDSLPLETLPFPNWDFDNKYYLRDGKVLPLTIKVFRKKTSWGGRYYYLTTTRGCPYQCAYCCNVNKNKLRRNSVSRIIQELKYAKKVMPFISGINVQDDSFFIGSDEWIADFCKRIKKQFSWPFIARLMPRFISEKRVEMLKKGNLEYISIGLQGSDRLNREIYGRNENGKSFTRACEILARNNINYVVDVILDNPYEKRSDLKEIANILNNIPRPYSVLAYSLTLFPGTRLHEMATKDKISDRLGADAYKSMFKATRPKSYKTPIPWRQLIELVLPQSSKAFSEKIISTGPEIAENKKIIARLYKSYKRRLTLVHKIKNLSPKLLRFLLSTYKKIIKLNILAKT